MDCMKVTVIEYQSKKKAIFDSLGRKSGNYKCEGVQCSKCPFYNQLYGCSEHIELENPIKAIRLVMNYEIPIDWSKVKVNAPILVKQFEEDGWLKRHFAKYEKGIVWAFNNGKTRWTNYEDYMTSWKYVKLVEGEE